MIHLVKDEQRKFTVVFIEPSGNKPKPQDIKNLKPVKVNPGKGLVLAVQLSPNHRWFGWLLGSVLTHYQCLEEKSTSPRWIGVYDASLCGAVIVSSDSRRVAVGDVVEVTFRDAITKENVRKGATVPYQTANILSAPHKQGTRHSNKTSDLVPS